MHRLSTSFILGYHGCDRRVGERLLRGEDFIPSNNDYDWLGPGIYFWESNPERGLDFARESALRKPTTIREPFAIGAVIDLGLTLDLTTNAGIQAVRVAYAKLMDASREHGLPVPENSKDGLLRKLDCAVMRQVHLMIEREQAAPIDTVRGIFLEGAPIYPTAGFHEKTHVQIAVCNPACINLNPAIRWK